MISRYILLFGGTNGKEEDDLVVFDDMYVLDTKTQVWAEITDKRGAVLEARDSFGMTEVNGIVYIFGGQGRSVGNEDVFYSELFRLKVYSKTFFHLQINISILFFEVYYLQ